MKTPKRIEPLVEDGLVDEVLRPLMSGKEAAVYVVRCGDELRCAKVYKEANKRSFRQAAEYQEGRKVRGSRQARAMAKGSKYGRKEQEQAWQNAEVAALFHLPNIVSPRVVLAGLGEQKKLDAAAYYRAVTESARALKSMPIDSALSFLTDVDVRTVISHTWVGDVFITLRAPDNTEVVLLDRPGMPPGAGALPRGWSHRTPHRSQRQALRHRLRAGAAVELERPLHVPGRRWPQRVRQPARRRAVHG